MEHSILSFYSCFNSEWVICEYLDIGLTLLNVAILKTYRELGIFLQM